MRWKRLVGLGVAVLLVAATVVAVRLMREPTVPVMQTVSKAGAPGEFAPLSMTVTLTPGDGTTRTQFTVRVRGRDGNGFADIDSVSWGDGDGYEQPRGITKCREDLSPERPGPTEFDRYFSHTWIQPGTYRLRVRVRSGPGGCLPDSFAPPESLEALLTVRITPHPTG